MASSPTEETPTAVALERVTEAYDRAFEALGRADTDRVQSLLNEAQAALTGLQAPERDSDGERQRRQRAMESHSRLTAAMTGGRREILRELKKIRQGRKILQTYGNRSESIGTRLRSEG